MIFGKKVTENKVWVLFPLEFSTQNTCHSMVKAARYEKYLVGLATELQTGGSGIESRRGIISFTPLSKG